MSGIYSLALRAWSLAYICQLRSPLSTMPLGRLALVAPIALLTSSSPIPYLFSAIGFNSTRTAGSELPPTVTCPMPDTCENFCASMVDAASYIWPRS